MDVERAAQRLLGLLAIGAQGADVYQTPFGPGYRDADTVRQALVRLRDGLAAQIEVNLEGVHLTADGQALRLPAECEAAVRALARGERLWAGALPELDESDSLVVARRLLRSGMLVTEPRD